MKGRGRLITGRALSWDFSVHGKIYEPTLGTVKLASCWSVSCGLRFSL